jgi:hypothetical protein
VADREEIRALVHAPRESLAVEIKRWLDPRQLDGIAKLVKCALAMRNYGGGHMIIGLDNKTGESVSDGYPIDVRAMFHADVIQPIISKFASKPFEVTVEFVERDARAHPVIGIPGGAQVPVATRAGLQAQDGTWLLRENRVYVRSLDANGTPSSAEARWSDWDQIVSMCFENRETDIARFLRRHFAGVTPDAVRSLVTGVSSNSPHDGSSGDVRDGHSEGKENRPESGEAPNDMNDVRARLTALINAGRQRFIAVQSARKVALPEHGAWETGALVLGRLPPMRPTQEFIARVLGANPNLTGWPIWFDSRSFSEPSNRPYVFEGAWESFVPDVSDSDFPNIDFWRISPPAEFYHYRAFIDDIPRKKRPEKPLTEFDFVIPLWRVAEAIAVALEYAKAIAPSPEGNDGIAMIFRWARLSGRILTSWSDSRYVLSIDRRAYQDEVMSYVTLPSNTPKSRIAEFVREATVPLYEVFDGFEAPTKTVDEVTNRVLERRW